MVGIRKTVVYVGLLLLPAVSFMIGFTTYHLNSKIVGAFKSREQILGNLISPNSAIIRMVGIRKTVVYVGLLLLPAVSFMIGFTTYHLNSKIVGAFKSREKILGNLISPNSARSFSLLNLNRDVESNERGTRDQKNSTYQRKPNRRYHVLINSYMNSGSRFTAGMFGFRSDSFYFYEPLWRVGLWDYFHRPNEVCSSIKYGGNCQKKTAEEVNIYREKGRIFQAISNVSTYSTPIQMMTDILDNIYNCKLNGMGNLAVLGVQDDYGGPGWKEYKSCIRKRVPKQRCLLSQEQKCKNAKHIVTKVLRLTTDSLESLLERNENIKVIHLFRDPRAIVNSRLESKGYPERNEILNAQALCGKMALDYQGGLRLMEKFAGRFKFVFYEDIRSNVEGTIRNLYDFVGMSFNYTDFQQLNHVKPNAAINHNPQMKISRSNDNAKWWRQYLSFSKYKGIEGMCKNVISTFNLTTFTNRQDLINMNIPSMTIPSALQVKT